MEMFQGASNHTARKELEIEGVSCMRFNQFKSKYFKYPRILCADVFCGTGTNEVGGEIIDGSPIRLLNGYKKAKNNQIDFGFWFSDIREAACKKLNAILQDTQPDVSCQIHQLSAAESIDQLHIIMIQDPRLFLFLILDPNGPKDFPRNEVVDLLRAFPKRVDVIPYISATTINRCIGARNRAGRTFSGWLGEIENFDHGFVSELASNGRKGWIRQPAKNDPQRWTMLPTFGCMMPRHNWKKQGFVEIHSVEGREAINHYCGGLI